jgi:hypothetical protein
MAGAIAAAAAGSRHARQRAPRREGLETMAVRGTRAEGADVHEGPAAVPGARVRVRCDSWPAAAAAPADAAQPGTTFAFELGRGEVCAALEKAAGGMRQGEVVEVRVHGADARELCAADPRLVAAATGSTADDDDGDGSGTAPAGRVSAAEAEVLMLRVEMVPPPPLPQFIDFCGFWAAWDLPQCPWWEASLHGVRSSWLP